MNVDTHYLAKALLDGDRPAIARAITVVETDGRLAMSIIKEIYHRSGRAYLVGVTGSPGVGKSTLVDRVISAQRSRGRTVGVLAVDPTSSFTGGAILGDRVRMQAHAEDPGVFMRSMATRGYLGGLARATDDVAVILDAAGFDVIVIETVGVGQSETEVSRTADISIVVTMPGLGDGVQVLKAGIMEIADLFVVNKSDHAGADRTIAEIETVLGFNYYGPEDWRPPVLRACATDGTGVDDVVEAVERFRRRGDGVTKRRRRLRILGRIRQLLSDRFLDFAERRALKPAVIDVLVDRVNEAELDPYSAADEIMDLVLSSKRLADGSDVDS